MSVRAPEQFAASVDRRDEEPKTYIDRHIDGGDRYRTPGFYQERPGGDLRDLHQLANRAFSVVGPMVDKIIRERKAVTIYHREHIRELWDRRPKNLDYVVLQKFETFDFNGGRYRFDNIFYNERSFIRFVLDKQATKQLIQELYQESYGGLVDEPESDLVKKVADALMEHSEDQTTRILNAIALLNKKPAASADAAEQRKTPNQEKKSDPIFKPVDDFVTPYEFYDVDYFLGLMSREYMVHKHPTLGFLIAL